MTSASNTGPGDAAPGGSSVPRWQPAEQDQVPPGGEPVPDGGAPPSDEPVADGGALASGASLPDEPPLPCPDREGELALAALGALPAAEQAALDEHLTGCRGCAETLGDLAAVAGLLRLADADHVADDVRVPPSLARTVEAALEAEAAHAGPAAPTGSPSPGVARLVPGESTSPARARSRHGRAGAMRYRNGRAGGGPAEPRWAVLAGIAAGVFVLGGAVGALLVRTGPAAPPGQARTAATAIELTSASGARASVRLSPRAWGSAVEVELSGAPAGEVLHVQVAGHHTRWVDAGTFRTVAGRTEEVQMSCAARWTGWARVEILAQDGQVLLSGSGPT